MAPPIHKHRAGRDPVAFTGVSTPLDQRREKKLRGLVPAAYIPLELDVER
jgi:hypothetical protein